MNESGTLPFNITCHDYHLNLAVFLGPSCAIALAPSYFRMLGVGCRQREWKEKDKEKEEAVEHRCKRHWRVRSRSRRV
jgi:hypothetical protein